MARNSVCWLAQLAWGSCVLILVSPTPLAAQDLDPPSAGQITEPTDSVSTRYTVPGEVVDALPVDRPGEVLPLQPGVTTNNRGELLLRGGSPGDVALYLDGVPILSAFRSVPFFGLTLSRALESRIAITPGAIESITVGTGPLTAGVGNGQAGAISIRTRDGSPRISGALGYESDEPFGTGHSFGLNRIEGEVGGSLGKGLGFFASGLLQGQQSIDTGFESELGPIFVQAGLDTTVAVPSAFNDPFADTTLVDVHDLAVSRGRCEDFRGSGNPGIADNHGLDCRGTRTPLSAVSSYGLLGKLTYRLGTRGRLSLLGVASQDQNRNFDYGTLYNALGVTGNRASSSVIILGWRQELTRSAERPLSLDAGLSFQSDRDRSGPLSTEGERNTADPFGGFLIRPLDLRFDFDNFAVDEELVRNHRTNQPGSRRSPYDLENPAQYSITDRYRNNAYGLYNRDDIATVLFAEGGGPLGPLTLYRENRTVGVASVSWQPYASNRVQIGGEFTRYSIANYFHFLESQTFSDVYREHPIRGALFVQDRVQLGGAAITGGLRYDFYDTRARRWAGFPRISSHPLYDPGDPDAFFTNDSLFPRDQSHGRVSPRLHASIPVSPRTSFRGSFAQQAQVPDFRLSLLGINTDISITDVNQVYGSDLDFERTDIFELGLSHRLAEDLNVDLAVYHRSVRSEAVVDLVSRFDPLFGFSRNLWVLTNGGTGRIRGIDLKLERRWGSILSGSLAYSYQDAKTEQPANPFSAAISFPSPDRPHSVAGALALNVPPEWKRGSLAGAILNNLGVFTIFRIASGTPYTSCTPLSANDPVLSPDLCASPVPGDLNDSRLPTFKQLDLRLTKRFGPGGRFTGYLDARNALNFRNVLAVFAVTGKTSNPSEAIANWAADSADLASEATASGVYRANGSIDLGEGQSDPRVGCGSWQDQAGNPAAPNCVYLIRAEERFGNGDHVFDLAEQRRASDALYQAVRGEQELTGPRRRIRVGVEASF